MLERLVLKESLIQGTSQHVKQTSAARVMGSFWRSIARSLGRSMDRSIARSLDRSVARSLAFRSIARSLARSPDRSLYRSLDCSIARSHARSLGRSLGRSIAPSVVRSVDRSVARSLLDRFTKSRIPKNELRKWFLSKFQTIFLFKEEPFLQLPNHIDHSSGLVPQICVWSYSSPSISDGG